MIRSSRKSACFPSVALSMSQRYPGPVLSQYRANVCNVPPALIQPDAKVRTHQVEPQRGATLTPSDRDLATPISDTVKINCGTGNTASAPNAGLMLGHRRRRRPNIKPTLGQTQQCVVNVSILALLTGVFVGFAGCVSRFRMKTHPREVTCRMVPICRSDLGPVISAHL